MKNQSRKSLLFFALPVVVILMETALFSHPPYAMDEKTNNALAVFSRVLEELKKNYVDEPDPEILVRHAIQGMMEHLDPYSVFLPPEAFDALKEKTRGGFAGIGAGVAMVKNRLTMVCVIEGTPAHRAGIKTGDKIIKIDNDSTAEMSLRDCVLKIKGPEGSRVRLTLVREGRPDSFICDLTRDFIPAHSVQGVMLDQRGFGYVAVRQFRENTVQDLNTALKILEASGKGLSGLILDFRNNTGGYLDQAVKMSDLFLDEGVIVSIKGRHSRDDRVFKATKNDIKRHYPLAVLINGGTASSSEVVAAALQEHKRAIILGSASYGKGSVQTVIPFKDGSGIKYTVARYYTPGNQSIQDRGVIPDIEVVPDSDFFWQEETAIINGQGAMGIEALKKDPGIAMALDLLLEKVLKK